MPLKEHVDILGQGSAVWNKWRKDNPDIKPDLSEANLSESDLSSANLNDVNLQKANLRFVDFNMTDLKRACLCGTDLYMAFLMTADFTDADLREANLSQAECYMTDFSRANMQNADLGSAVLWEAKLVDTNLTNSEVGETIFANVDLSKAKGLDTVKQTYPSTIGIDTIYRSGGKIPKSFLQGAGIPDAIIDLTATLRGNPKNFYSCFISYSSKDSSFAERLHSDLQNHGVRCWFAPKNLKIGDRIRQTLDKSIRTHDMLLLVLSENSIGSEWVEKEVETAFEEERKRGKMLFFPVSIDTAVMDTKQAWARDIHNSRHIGDFTQWKDDKFYQKGFERLLRDLESEE